ncbi:MAG: hypothetical protein FWE58_04280 [Methanobrevibacter sp.]|nr:hypothetical protein [Methanobrevibacter sp.]
MKTKYKGFLILLVLMILFLSVNFVSAENITGTTNTTGNSTADSDGSVSPVIPNLTKPTEVKVKRPAKVSQSAIISAAKKVKTQTDRTKLLPDYVTISKFKFTMPEFYYLMAKTIDNRQKGISSSITPKYGIKDPNKPSGTWVKGKIYSYFYAGYARKVISSSEKLGRVPNTITTAGGNKLQYQTTIYLFAKTLANTKKNLPYFVNINIKAANPINQYEPFYSRNPVNPMTKTIGKNSLGNVQVLGPYGNLNSKVRVAYIIGQHPLESNSHNALLGVITANHKNMKYMYYIYKINVIKDPQSFDKGRLNGQKLAQRFVVHHIRHNKYNLVVDVHSNQGTNGGNYEKTNFVFAPLNHQPSRTIANNIIRQISGLSYYFPPSQTSPEYSTEPIVRSGIKTLVYETYLYENTSTTINLMKQFVARVDSYRLK